MACTLIVLVLLFPGPCAAGGFGWLVTVNHLEFASDGEFVLRVTPDLESLNFPRGCAELTVVGGYSNFRWFLFGDEKMTFENHMQALRFLSSHSPGELFFGQMGAGLGKDGGANCRALSRGLMLVTEDGSTGVYSYYKWP